MIDFGRAGKCEAETGTATIIQSLGTQPSHVLNSSSMDARKGAVHGGNQRMKQGLVNLNTTFNTHYQHFVHKVKDNVLDEVPVW